MPQPKMIKLQRNHNLRNLLKSLKNKKNQKQRRKQNLKLMKMIKTISKQNLINLILMLTINLLPLKVSHQQFNQVKKLLNHQHNRNHLVKKINLQDLIKIFKKTEMYRMKTYLLISSDQDRSQNKFSLETVFISPRVDRRKLTHAKIAKRFLKKSIKMKVLTATK